ncbi:MAG: ABC transporter ATP-binding protein [SAR324 cluster bacterium]|jgi:lipooligosaccharide transport system ATP-binding protein|nr:ABC transporter ATP-binding protein [SAR324 cluster bacterium]MDP7630289.1 ABC transporter ATP-binding protein [SAR324 cluster bacterium]
MNPPLLQVSGLAKTYGEVCVVDQLDLTLESGMVLGLLGPNGAGKTTTLRMLYGFIDPTAGRIEYEGRDFRKHRTEIKRWIGVCTQHDSLDEDFSILQNLEMHACYFRPRIPNLRERITELVELFELQEYRFHSPRQLSGGYRRRLMIARSVIHHPQVLFLDEPTTGLDPKARMELWELIDRMRSEGMGVILTTHYMDEAERLSDQLVMLLKGRSVSRGTPASVLGEMLGEHVVAVPPDQPQDEVQAWAKRHGLGTPMSILGEQHLPLTGEQLAAFSEKFPNLRFQVRPPNLDDLFFRLSLPVEQKEVA